MVRKVPVCLAIESPDDVDDDIVANKKKWDVQRHKSCDSTDSFIANSIYLVANVFLSQFNHQLRRHTLLLLLENSYFLLSYTTNA